MEVICYVFYFVVLFFIGCLLATIATSHADDFPVTENDLNSIGIKLGKWYVYTPSTNAKKCFFVPLEVDSIGFRYFISFDNLCGGDTFHTTKIDDFKGKIEEVTYDKIFN